MSEKMIEVQGVDPLLFRDGRPFGNEDGALSAKSLPVPMPGTFAGFVRTYLGNKAGWNWANDGPERALATPVLGPLMKRNGQFVFAAPADAVVFKNSNDQLAMMRLRPKPISNGEGCNLPHEDLLPLEVSNDVKPESGYHFWKWEDMERWLRDEEAIQAPEKIEGLVREDRVHVAIEEGKGTAKEGALFTVEYRSFLNKRWEHWDQKVREDWSLIAKIETEETASLTGVGLLGGEKRVAQVEELDSSDVFPSYSKELNDAIKNSRHVRMILATPAIFSGGWKPGWLNDQLQGSPPGTDVTLKLISAAVKRREAVSGWDYKARGPKAVRWLVPAGSVYFFEVVSGSSEKLLQDVWLRPVHPQDCEDGYGIALWGKW